MSLLLGCMNPLIDLSVVKKILTYFRQVFDVENNRKIGGKKEKKNLNVNAIQAKNRPDNFYKVANKHILNLNVSKCFIFHNTLETL